MAVLLGFFWICLSLPIFHDREAKRKQGEGNCRIGTKRCGAVFPLCSHAASQ